MTPPPDLLRAAIELIDAANAQDPNLVFADGAAVAGELLRGRRAHHWLLVVDPAADAAQQLAARAHHYRRWTRPRSAFPEGRAGYLRWRRSANGAQADEVAELLTGLGLERTVVDECRLLMSKQAPAGCGAAASHEDAVCLAFFECDAERVAGELGADRAGPVIAKTLAKMSERGRDVLGSPAFPPAVRALLPAG